MGRGESCFGVNRAKGSGKNTDLTRKGGPYQTKVNKRWKKCGAKRDHSKERQQFVAVNGVLVQQRAPTKVGEEDDTENWN